MVLGAFFVGLCALEVFADFLDSSAAGLKVCVFVSMLVEFAVDIITISASDVGASFLVQHSCFVVGFTGCHLTVFRFLVIEKNITVITAIELSGFRFVLGCFCS